MMNMTLQALLALPNVSYIDIVHSYMRAYTFSVN